MNEEYKKALAGLNSAQRQAVETIYGPALVIAGPGTGKTQLIGTRAGYILDNTDARPADILCLTFTNSGVEEMRNRLVKLIGQDAYNINVYTYHAFGGEVLRRNPEYFDDEQLEPIEDLRKDIILREIINKLPYDNPLKYADSYLADLAGFIKDAKQALLSPEDVEATAKGNLSHISSLNRGGGAILSQISIVSAKSVPIFKSLLGYMANAPAAKLPRGITSIGQVAADELKLALESFDDSGKTYALSDWKRRWLEKDARGNFVISGQKQNEKLLAAAGIYKDYQLVLKTDKLYDFEDMVLRAVRALENYPDLKYSLAEQFQFIMLDEFQDTNHAQFRLVELLTDHPVLEGKPNVLAVGDDDQAIYAFQGADHANMARFSQVYENVQIISLSDNYRARKELLEVAHNLAGQIEQRLHHRFPGVEKRLAAANQGLPTPTISAREFKTDAAEYAWVASEINKLIVKGGVPAREIAVLAPKHKYLESLVPFLAELKLPVAYKKRENILEMPIIRQLTQMARLALALNDQNQTVADELWPEVLSYNFWGLDTEAIWRISWKAKKNHAPWTDLLLGNSQTKAIAQLFLELAAAARMQPLELMLDALLGLPEAGRALKLKTTSPLYENLSSPKAAQTNSDEFIDLISALAVLRSKLRDWSHGRSGPLDLRALVEFIEGYRAAGLSVLNESPYHQAEDSVNLMTAYDAKGREFKAVFLIGCTDDIWGSASRSQSQRISLPVNLSFIRYRGASEDERLRLLYVAATRAKTHLYFLSYRQTLAGKKTLRLKYLDVIEDEAGAVANVLPDEFARVVVDNSDSITPEVALDYWTARHLPPFKPRLRTVLAPQLGRFQLSATDLNRFIDLERGGPDAFFLKSVLGFPEAPTQTAIYGTAIHDTLKWVGGRLKLERKLPSQKQALDYFSRQLMSRRLPASQFELLELKGHGALAGWYKLRVKQLSVKDMYEFNFRDQGVFVGKAHLAGKVDRMVIDERNKTIQVIDYKTGQAFSKWSSHLKLHKFRQQLMFYKLLVEGSKEFHGYRVESGLIEFVEAQEGDIILLELNYDEKEMDEFKRLITAVWQHLQKLDFPDTKKYAPTLTGVRKFEAELLK